MFSVISQKAAPHDYDLRQKGNTPGESPVHPGFLHEATFRITGEGHKTQAEHSECIELRWRVELRYCYSSNSPHSNEDLAQPKNNSNERGKEEGKKKKKEGGRKKRRKEREERKNPEKKDKYTCKDNDGNISWILIRKYKGQMTMTTLKSAE